MASLADKRIWNPSVERNNTEITFTFLSLRDRGWFSSSRRLFPIKKIILFDDGISFITKFGTETFKNVQLDKLSRVREKGYIGNLYAYPRVLLVFHFGDIKRVIDVSSKFPDYENNGLLLNELEKRFSIEDDPLLKVRVFDWVGIGFTFVILLSTYLFVIFT